VVIELDFTSDNRKYQADYYKQNKEKKLKQAKINYQKNKSKKLEQAKIRYRNNREELVLKRQEYVKNNKSKVNKQSKKYYETHKNDVLIRVKEYYKAHKEERSASKKQYRLKHEDTYKKYMSEYWKRPHVLLRQRIRSHIRRRMLGFEPLNAEFENSHFHHMYLNASNAIGIYIPAKLHKSIWHNGKTGENIKKINKAALLWLCEQSIIAVKEKNYNSRREFP